MDLFLFLVCVCEGGGGGGVQLSHILDVLSKS